MSDRFFEVIDYPKNGINSGNFKGKYPGQAARKIFNKLAKSLNFTNSANKNILVFEIREKKENAKILKYVGTRVTLVKPNIIYKNGKPIVFKYKPVVTSYKNYYD